MLMLGTTEGVGVAGVAAPSGAEVPTRLDRIPAMVRTRHLGRSIEEDCVPCEPRGEKTGQV